MVNTKRLGRTDLEISEIVLGGGYVGGVFLHGDDDTRRRVLSMALDNGVNWVDTAPSYGDGQSESVIGRLLGEFAADDRPRISTKVSIDASTGDIQGQIRASLEESFTRLNVSHVTLLQLHNPLGNGPKQLPIDSVLGRGGVVDTFSMLKTEGVIDYAGFTALGSPKACIEAVDSGHMDTAQVYFNLINPSAGVAVASDWHSEDYRHLLSRCHAQDVGVLAIRVYAAGLLASRDRHGREIPVTSNAAYDAERQRADAISIAIARMPGTAAQKALRFVLDHPHVDAAVIGLADVDHLEQALAVPGMASVPDDVGAALDTLWQNNYLQSLGRHS